jgi:ssDNA-binding Zn-finger/Zn-ribbon topoisomerase 1
MIYLVCNDKNLYLDLKSLGMVSSKTEKDRTGEFHFPELSKDLIPHFIRGYFDADGSFWYPTRTRSRNSLKTEIGCATKNFLLSIKNILDKNGIELSYIERLKAAGNNKQYATYTLLSSNRDLSERFRDFIYNNSSIHLEYKYNLSHKSKDLVTAFDIFGACPKCGSSNVKKNGTRDGKWRLKCNDCSIGFTKPMPTSREIVSE